MQEKGTVDMDDSVRRTENGIQEAPNEAALEEILQKMPEQLTPSPDAEQIPTENAAKKGPELKETADGQTPEENQEPSVPKINPALKYGRRMDYKTAKVNDKQTRDLNLSMPSSAPVPVASHKPSEDREEPKSALELELEALEAAAAGKSSQPIPNPLPTPKKRVPKEMEFDIEPPDYAMHFDLVDLHGKDYFDIN